MSKVKNVIYNNKIRRIINTDNGQELDAGFGCGLLRFNFKQISSYDKQINVEAVRAATIKSAKELSLAEHLIYAKEINNYKLTDKFKYHEDVFELAENVSPSEAIRSLFLPTETQLEIECALALSIILFKALLDVIGDQVFDKIFSKNGEHQLVLSSGDHLLLEQDFLQHISPPKFEDNESCDSSEKESDSFLGFLHNYQLKQEYIAKDTDKFLEFLQEGDVVFIYSFSDYTKIHPVGDPGYNLVFLGFNEEKQPLFGGLFDDKKLYTYDDIMNLFVHDYNLMMAEQVNKWPVKFRM